LNSIKEKDESIQNVEQIIIQSFSQYFQVLQNTLLSSNNVSLEELKIISNNVGSILSQLSNILNSIKDSSRSNSNSEQNILQLLSEQFTNNQSEFQSLMNQSFQNIQYMHTLQEDFIVHDANFAQSFILMNQNIQAIDAKISELNNNQLILNSSMDEIKSSQKRRALIFDKVSSNLTILCLHFDLQIQNTNTVSKNIKMSLGKSNQIIKEVEANQKISAESLKIQ
jgi:hypothetical protein